MTYPKGKDGNAKYLILAIAAIQKMEVSFRNLLFDSSKDAFRDYLPNRKWVIAEKDALFFEACSRNITYLL